MRAIRRFIGGFQSLPTGFIQRLNDNLEVLAAEDGPVSTSTNGYTLRAGDKVGSLYVDTTAANTTIYLPESPTGSQRRTVVKVVAANVLIIDGNGNTIYGPGGWAAGVSQAFLNGRWESLTFEPTGSAWAIVGAVP